MKILITLAVTMIYLCSTELYAQAGSTTSSSITNSSTAGESSTTYSTTTSTTTTSRDDVIISDIYKKYNKDPALIGTTLTVSSQNGTVNISGTVTAQAQADAALIAAKSVEGVKEVKSSIKVTTNPAFNSPTKTPNY